MQGYDGGLYRVATLLLEAIQAGAKAPVEKRCLYRALEALGQAEIESLESLYQLETAEKMSDRNFKEEN